MKKNLWVLTAMLAGLFISCQSGKKEETMLRIETTKGNITVKLYNETPKHRDNFIKLVKDSVYNGTLFHRVINNFMIQAGDPESKDAPADKMLGGGDVGYTIPAEFVYPKYFHKKGALSAARQGDMVNPKKASSGCQFYIVTGQVYDEASLKDMETQLDNNRTNLAFGELVAKRREDIAKMQQENDQAGLQKLETEFREEAQKMVEKQPHFKFTPEQEKAYTTIGGTPHLDGQYTVFGEVVDGLDVVDSIQVVPTNRSDRPLEDIKILRVVAL